jgi:hypothetical protein
MNRDRIFLKRFLEKKIRDIETNNFTEDDHARLRDYFLHDLTNNGMTRDRDLKKYLFTGFFLFHNKDFRDIINESCE